MPPVTLFSSVLYRGLTALSIARSAEFGRLFPQKRRYTAGYSSITIGRIIGVRPVLSYKNDLRLLLTALLTDA